MAREIVVERGGAESRFGLTRLSRDKLYGRRKRLVVDEQGRLCQPASLTIDGEALLGPGSTAGLYLDEGFDVVDRGDLIAVDPDGKALDKLPSTLNTAQPLKGPVPPARLLDCVTTAVYLLEADDLDADLRQALERGEVFETRFNYRGGYADSPLFLLANSEGFFGLVGEEAAFEPLVRERPGVDDDVDPFADDDLDFEMF
ncbi:MAG: hypothetical protein CSA66_01685 [Proteobacteria bacterium]|nr:MAG: hypothetical protein CSA66_01685 [Pseudomonadota bacterium]